MILTRKLFPRTRYVILMLLASFSLLFLARSVFTSDAKTNSVKKTSTPQQEKTLSKKEAARLYVHKVLPLLQKKCSGCHGESEKDREGELNLSTRAGMLKGGESGETSLVPGKPEKSSLYLSLDWKNEDLQMPPKERNRLTVKEISLVKQWITAGAPVPTLQEIEKIKKQKWNDTAAEGTMVITTDGLSPTWTKRKYKPEDIWMWQPIKKYPVPVKGIDASKDSHPIDAFIQQKLSEKKMTPAKKADRRTIMRRLTLNLTGLPPTTAELNEYANDNTPHAYKRVVERLLASPHYGEQMATRWLDVVRYADTAGFANDFERPNAWRYRDYVVRSFNADKPYDKFVTEQLAGDELKKITPETLTATGFLRMGPWEHTSMSVAALTRQQFLDDVTHSVGVTFLGQGLRCCKCHDHKFDPIPTRDYYRVKAVFAPIQFADRKVPYQPYENTRGFKESKKRSDARLQETLNAQKVLSQKQKKGKAAYLKKRGVKTVNELPLNERGRFLGFTELEKSMVKVYRKRKDYLLREQKRYQPILFSVYNGPPRKYDSPKLYHYMPRKKEPRKKLTSLHILASGSLAAPLDKVTPGVLSAVYASNDQIVRTKWNSIPNKTVGRRVAFARWVASPQNTLTARVIVNRVWQWNFGTGLVATSNSFGRMGAKPSHPELLDWLATWFIENGWSIKKLEHLIVTSDTYQQASSHAEIHKLREIDSKNSLLAYFPTRRLTAEELRDSMLAITHELNPALGGLPIFPEINWEVAMQPRQIMGSVAPAYQPSPTKKERNRRTIYAYRYRTLSDPLLEVFNKPGSDISCERRDETTVTPQVFALFNSQFSQNRSVALASYLAKTNQKTAGQIEQVFQMLFYRKPTEKEMHFCQKHLKEMTLYHQKKKPVKVPLPTEVKREMVEELTGKPFSWTEQLANMKNYERDLQPADVDAPTRALAELCLVLLNSNEFVFVR
ncbi:protein of unknown function DUF1549 [hydrothermal vent metagenome]|uniref:Cytochrome c domain-containing protein n=1 Tax=hydrothermal vent metagenome TaxID=652676 RepID=A0A3B1E0G8_9ZZZZ